MRLLCDSDTGQIATNNWTGYLSVFVVLTFVKSLTLTEPWPSPRAKTALTLVVDRE